MIACNLLVLLLLRVSPRLVSQLIAFVSSSDFFAMFVLDPHTHTHTHTYTRRRKRSDRRENFLFTFVCHFACCCYCYFCCCRCLSLRCAVTLFQNPVTIVLADDQFFFSRVVDEQQLVFTLTIEWKSNGKRKTQQYKLLNVERKKKRNIEIDGDCCR